MLLAGRARGAACGQGLGLLTPLLRGQCCSTSSLVELVCTQRSGNWAGERL